MIKSLKVEKVNGWIDFDKDLNSDINIITGRNGSGKTTIIKLMWYLMSGNIERVFREMTFNGINFITDDYSLSLNAFKDKKSGQRYRIKYSINNGESREATLTRQQADAGPIDLINVALAAEGSHSVFFPTFRRIEGGFSTSGRNLSIHDVRYPGDVDGGRGIQGAMAQLSERLSVMGHRFVSSISTNDIVALITKQYADISDKSNLMHTELSNSIIKRIENYGKSRKKDDAQKLDDAKDILKDIQDNVESVSRKREDLFRSFTVLTSLVKDIFQHDGIELTKGIALGEARNAISSDKLSAGEKQMLSFICYNSFNRNSCIFIDEPELSLHVDWQRILLSTLLSQETNNQFIVATHSPFIYAKYPDKELDLGTDRGGE